ncbi:MAG: DNA methyltransferase [Candidatus Heimdallarchaeaceae archaeon]
MTIKSITREELTEYFRGFTLHEGLSSLSFKDAKPKTIEEKLSTRGIKISRYINEFWSSKQRQSSSIHEISYRACFKAQLPRFFIKLLSKPKDLVYDPFSGRGTTVIEAGILGRRVISNDVNPLSEILTYPRFFIPTIKEIQQRLSSISFDSQLKADIDLSMFYHPTTEAEIVSLRSYLEQRKLEGEEDILDKWIRMVATNRLTGHSKGFFSVYTLPPNQAVSQKRQIKINKKRNQKPDYRNVKALIIRKTSTLLRTVKQKEKENLLKAGQTARFLTEDARETKSIESESVDLIVTSPPFLDVVQYSKDNWLRCWFNNIAVKEIDKRITIPYKIEKWSQFIGETFKEFNRIIKPKGFVAFEVGEVRRGTIELDEYVVPLGLQSGFDPIGIIVNLQEFTKTANIWGVGNNNFGTNTNRIVLFQKPE